MPPPLFHIVLHEPEIPNNTGNIGRTCIAAGCSLHLVRPLGFDTSEKALRRAGLDYWPRLGVIEHADWPSYLAAATPQPRARWFTSGKGGVPVWQADFRPGDHLVFGKETAGLPDELLDEASAAGRLLHLPMVPGERGLNLATVVCAVVWEGIRQCIARGECSLDDEGRLRIPAG
jgi:tRNA (cytidine/uridine-2'-O-)-methyltransferase